MIFDHELIVLLKRGDEESLRRIFELYYEKLCLYAETLVKDQQVAEDIVEELFIRLWENAQRIHITTSFNNYLYRSTYNNCLKYIQKSKLEKKAFTAYVYQDKEIIGWGTSDNPFATLVSRELEEEARRVVDSLPEKCREIFILSRYENLSYPEIAEKLKITLGTVKTQMSRAFRKLREELKEFLPLLFLFFFR